MLKSRIFFAIVLAVIAGAILSVVFRGENELRGYVGETIEITGRIKSDPDYDGKVLKLKLDQLQTDFIQDLNIHDMIYITGQIPEEVQRGDRITIRGELEEGFGAYIGTFYRPTVLKISKAEPGSLLLRLRKRFATSVKNVLGEDNTREASLGLAYLLGMRNELDSETLEILSLVGLTHIVVASGTHLGILVGFFKKYFGKVSRFSGLLFSLCFIFIFGEMIGWTASITRAAIVAVLALIGWYYGRKFEPIKIILLAMAITLVINPMNVTDLGWLLSFGSFTGILVLAPELTRFFYGKQKPNPIAEIILATFAATLMCAPILLYFFGNLSLISVIANLLILPTIPVVMGLVFLSGIVGFLPNFFLFTIAQKAVMFITTAFLKYHLLVMEFFAKRTEFIIQIPSGKTGVFLLYIVILAPFIFGSFVRAQKKRKLREKFEENFAENIRFTVD